MPAGEHGFSEKARQAGLEARLRNARLRKQGLLPPKKSPKKESFPLDHPIFTPDIVSTHKKVPKQDKPDNRDIILRLLDLVEKLL